jgi:hypothetical protein
VRAVIDRFEESHAILLFGDDEVKVELPRVLLPPGAAEGDILTVTFQIDYQATRDQKRKVAGLLDKLKKDEHR